MLEKAVTATEPLVVLTGTAGTGKSTLLARLSDKLAATGCRVVAISCTTGGDLMPIRFSTDDPSVMRLPLLSDIGSDWAPIGPVAGAADDPGVAARAAHAIATRLLAGGRPTTLLIDDVQHLDPDTFAVLYTLVPVLAGTPARCVVATRATLPAATAPRVTAMVRKLRERGLVSQLRLAPLAAGAIARELTATLRATPEPALVRHVHALSRGLPAMLTDVVETLRRNGSITVVDRTALLTPSTAPLAPPARVTVPGLPHDAGSAANALAVLAPLGAAVPAQLASALRVPEDRALGLLDLLRDAGVVHRGRKGASWRFVVPFVGLSLETRLGPFERRHLAATFVNAVWSGAADCPDDALLADRVADAGCLLDARRASAELVRTAEVNESECPARALRWLAAARELSSDRATTARTLRSTVVTAFAAGETEHCVATAETLLGGYVDDLAPADVQAVRAVATTAVTDAGELRAIAEGARCWPGSGEHAIVTRAQACALLGRWHDAIRLLGGSEPEWRVGDAASAVLADDVWATAELWTGSPRRFERVLAGARDWSERRADRIATHVTALLVLGETGRATRLLSECRADEAELPLPCRSLLAASRGHAERAVDLARRAIATATPNEHEPAMYHAVVATLVARGELTSAREFLAAADEITPALPVPLAVARALVDRAFGDHDGARGSLLRCTAEAARQGVHAGTELAWSELVDLALDRGDRSGTQDALTALDRLAATLPTERTRLLSLLAHATVEKDDRAARECARLATARGNPLERSMVLRRLVQRGLCEPRLLTDAYLALGRIDAVLYRAWLRGAMREHGVSVPGRAETLAENERLLAMLAAGGLSNKQLATTLRASERSVEGRLSRLFARTGYRSRIELSTAMLAGELRA